MGKSILWFSITTWLQLEQCRLPHYWTEVNNLKRLDSLKLHQSFYGKYKTTITFFNKQCISLHQFHSAVFLCFVLIIDLDSSFQHEQQRMWKSDNSMLFCVFRLLESFTLSVWILNRTIPCFFVSSHHFKALLWVDIYTMRVKSTALRQCQSSSGGRGRKKNDIALLGCNKSSYLMVFAIAIPGNID